MNRTINVNIGGMPFTVDEEAHLMLHSYFTQIEGRLSPMERPEIMEDVENRIADIFSNRLNSRNQVINTAMAREAINIIGSADNFGDLRDSEPSPRPTTAANTARKGGLGFYRSAKDKILGGVCGGLSVEFGIDVVILRLIFVLVVFISFSALFWIYIILWIVVPVEPTQIIENNLNDERR